MALKTPHHTQIKSAAKMDVTIDATGKEYVLTTDEGIVAQGTDLKALLAELAEQFNSEDFGGFEVIGEVEDVEEGDEEEGEDARSVVKSKYKALYAQSTIKGTNDDRFAAAFRAETVNEDGELDKARVLRVARANKVDMSKYGTSSRGWQGRQRMTLGNILRGMVRQGVDVEIGSKTFKGEKVEKAPRKSRAKAK